MIEEPIANADLPELFFDVDGEVVDRKEFYRLYPDGRERITRNAVLSLAVSTEFVGINHNPNPSGGPWIYETIVLVDGDVVFSKWTGNIISALNAHEIACLRVRLGGFVWWRARNYFQRARARLRRAL